MQSPAHSSRIDVPAEAKSTAKSGASLYFNVSGDRFAIPKVRSLTPNEDLRNGR